MVVGSNDTGEVEISPGGMVLIVFNDEDHAVFNILFWSRWVTGLSAPEPAQKLWRYCPHHSFAGHPGRDAPPDGRIYNVSKDP